MEKFKLSDNFIAKFKRKKPPFGFNGLGELVYMRTYSRIKEDGKNERWWETVQRVVEGTYTMQKNWIDSHQLGWNPWQAQKSAQDKMNNSQEFLRKELKNKYKDMEKKVEGFELNCNLDQIYIIFIYVTRKDYKGTEWKNLRYRKCL